MDRIKLSFPARLDYLRLAAAVTREVCRRLKKNGLDEPFTSDVELCVNEACTNAIKHGYRDRAGEMISLEFNLHPEKIVIKVRDKGKGFSLDEIPPPDLEKLPDRGYGLFIIRAKMDHVKYVQEKGQNFLEMIRLFRLTSLEGDP